MEFQGQMTLSLHVSDEANVPVPEGVLSEHLRLTSARSYRDKKQVSCTFLTKCNNHPPFIASNEAQQDEWACCAFTQDGVTPYAYH